MDQIALMVKVDEFNYEIRALLGAYGDNSLREAVEARNMAEIVDSLIRLIISRDIVLWLYDERIALEKDGKDTRTAVVLLEEYTFAVMERAKRLLELYGDITGAAEFANLKFGLVPGLCSYVPWARVELIDVIKAA